MKKLVALLATLALMMLAVTAFAAAPGETVTVPIYVETSNAAYVKVRVTLEGGWGTISGLTSVYGAASSKTINGSGNPVVPSGKFGTASVQLSDTIAAGTYKLTVTVSEAFDINENDASATAYSGTITIEKPACEHTFSAWTVTTPATCTEAGVETRECTLCGEKETREVAETGHAYDDGKQTKAPTCKEEGVMTFTCANCGDTYTEAIAKSDKHAWDNGVITKEMECLVDGEKTFTCTVCGLTDVTVIKAPGKHTYDENDLKTDVPPTCTENGKGSFTCTACGEKIDGGVIAALGHDKKETITAATCGKDGKKVVTCSRCDFEETEVIPATGEHALSEKITKEPTCGAKGEKQITCANCDYSKTEEIAATGKHTYEEKVTTEPSCGKEGEKTFTCSVCGDSYTEKIAALEHEYTSEVTKEPTCGAKGEETFTCSNCGDTYTKEIEATGEHNYEEKVTTEAGCLTEGEKTFTCTVCGDSYTEKIDAKGHTPGEDLKEELPTCSKPGYKYYTCVDCGTEVKESDIPKVDHDFQVTEEIPATCTENGKRVYTCSFGCGKTKTETLKKLGHKMGEWVVSKAATCTEDGEEKRECENGCGKTETRVVKADHVWGDWIVDQEAGTKTHVCTLCGLEEVKRLGTHYTMNVCTNGIRFRDLDKSITKDWYMFTPIDLSVDGEQTIDLIAGNMHKIGTATVLVKEGKVTVTTRVSNPSSIAYVEEFLTFIPAIADVTKLDFDALTPYAFGQEISIEEDLAGDTKVLLLIRNKAWYEDRTYGVKRFNGKGEEYNAYVEELKLLMD